MQWEDVWLANELDIKVKFCLSEQIDRMKENLKQHETRVHWAWNPYQNLNTTISLNAHNSFVIAPWKQVLLSNNVKLAEVIVCAEWDTASKIVINSEYISKIYLVGRHIVPEVRLKHAGSGLGIYTYFKELNYCSESQNGAPVRVASSQVSGRPVLSLSTHDGKSSAL